MSYILEALRKSEESRRYRDGSELSVTDTPRGRTAHPIGKFMPLLSLALLVNAAVLGAWLFWSDREPTQVATVARVVTETPAVRAPAPPPAPAASPGSVPASPAPSVDAVDPTWRQRAPQPIGALPTALRARLPALSISTHIYASDPRDREVSINGRTYREGDSVQGLEVLRITETGARLGFEQRVLDLDLREGWD